MSSLGSLFVRIVLQPFEEAAFVTFARKQSVTAAPTEKTLRENESRVLSMLLKVAILLGAIAVRPSSIRARCAITVLMLLPSSTQALHGPQFSQLALRVLYGRRWADTEGRGGTWGRGPRKGGGEPRAVRLCHASAAILSGQWYDVPWLSDPGTWGGGRTRWLRRHGGLPGGACRGRCSYSNCCLCDSSLPTLNPG